MNLPPCSLLRTPLSCLGGLCALMGAAQAQDAFNPYGMDGRGIEDLRGGTRLPGAGLVTPRVGFKSAQDAAYRPGFALQTGLSLDDGSSLGGGFFPVRMHDPTRVESPPVGGFRLGVQSGFGEVVQGFGGNQVQDTYARYSQGPVDISAGLVEDRGGLMTPQLNQRGWVVGAAYSVGGLRVHGAYQTLEDRAGANLGGSGWWVGADYRLGSNLVRVQYVVNQPRSLDSARSEGLGVAYEYSLSRSTTLYSGLSYFRYQDNAGLARGALSMPGAQTHGSDNDITQRRGGMRFSF